MEKTGCKIICGAPTTLTVKGLIMMMMMTMTRSLDLHCLRNKLKDARDSYYAIRPAVMLDTVFHNQPCKWSLTKARF